jgi:hypothetical protein
MAEFNFLSPDEPPYSLARRAAPHSRAQLKMATTTVSALHDEELLAIFSCLSIGALAACRGTCRSWRRLARETIDQWDRSSAVPEPRSAAWLCTEGNKAAAIAAALEFLRSLDFTPNLGIVTLSKTFSARNRDEIVQAIGRELPHKCVLAGASCAGAMGPPPAPAAVFAGASRATARSDEPVEYEGGHSITLHLQWLSQSSVHFFALSADQDKPIVDEEPAVRGTRSGRAEGKAGYFDLWFDHVAQLTPSPAVHSSMLVFTAPSSDEEAQRTLDYIDGCSFPICGGQASGTAPRVYLYCGAKGGLLSAAGRASTVFLCIHSQVVAMRTCVVCEEWGSGAHAQAVAMQLFTRDAECNHFDYRLLTNGPRVLERVHAAFIISCIGRGAGFHEGTRDCESRALVRQFGEQAPTLTGFFSMGEIGASGHACQCSSHTFACVVALFGRAPAETERERADRVASSRCGFRNCVCESADPFDDNYMVHNHPFQ